VALHEGYIRALLARPLVVHVQQPTMVRQQLPKCPPALESPPQHGQADYPPSDDTASSAPDMVAYVEDPGSDSISSVGDSMEAELGGTASESMGTTTDSMNVEPRHSLLDTTTSSGQSSDEMPAARRSPILFMMPPGVREPARVQQPTSPILFTSRPDLVRCPVPARVLQPRSPILFTSRPGVRWLPPSEPEDQGQNAQNPDTTDSLESDSDVSMLTEGYAADTESGPEVEYTGEKGLFQEEIWAICVAQRAENGNALALFRVPPKKCGICPICKIGMPQNK